MRSSYNWESNEINFKDTNNVKYLLKLKGNKTIVHGESATGKTMLYEALQDLKDDINTKFKPYNTDNIVLINNKNKDILRTIENKLVIIDRADLVLNKELIELINKDRGTNRYLLFMRAPMGIELSPNYFGELRINKETKTIYLDYKYNIKGWN